MSKIVRLRPYNRRKGHLLRRYVHNSQKFVHGKWYEVNDAMGESLSMVVSRQDDDDSPLAFDVFDTKADAQALLRAEKLAKAKSEEQDPVVGVLTTADLNDDEEAAAARKVRAEAALERAKSKRQDEKQKSDRKAKRQKQKDATATSKDGGDSPGEAEPVGEGAKDPYE